MVMLSLDAPCRLRKHNLAFWMFWTISCIFPTVCKTKCKLCCRIFKNSYWISGSCSVFFFFILFIICMWIKSVCFLFFFLSGCVSGMDEVNSRTMGVVLHSCESLCEFHRVLQRAEDRLKRSLCIDGVTRTHGHDHTRECGFRDVCSSETVSKHTTTEREAHTNRRNHRDPMRCKFLV